jgi:hypothetical protein
MSRIRKNFPWLGSKSDEKRDGNVLEGLLVQGWGRVNWCRMGGMIKLYRGGISIGRVLAVALIAHGYVIRRVGIMRRSVARV